MKHVQLITLLLAAALTACSSDDGTETPPASHLMTVEVTENPFIDSETGSRISLSPLRKADATTTSSLDEFSMNYMDLYKYDFTKANGKWGPTTYSWPVENESAAIDFYAYTGNIGYIAEKNKWIFHYESTNPYISFSVDQNASTQHDLLVAHTKTSYKADGGKVCFTFDHACAAVQFRIGQSHALYNNVTFTKIALVGVYNQGDCFYKYVDDEFKPTWDNLSGAENSIYTLESGSSISIPVSQTKHQGARPLTCGYLFMIPQSLYTAKLLIEYSYKSNNYYYDIPMAQTSDDKLEAGVEYTINVRLGSELLTDGTEKTTSTQ